MDMKVKDDPGVEKELWAGRPSPWIYGNRWLIAFVLAPLLVGIGYGGWLWLSARCTRYRLTTERLVWERGVFNRRVDQVELYRVRDVSLVKPWWLRSIGLGNVIVYSSDITTPNDGLLAIRKADAVQDLVRAVVEDVRERKGIRAIDFETRG